MSENLTLGGSPLSLEDVERVAGAGGCRTRVPAARVGHGGGRARRGALGGPGARL